MPLPFVRVEYTDEATTSVGDGQNEETLGRGGEGEVAALVRRGNALGVEAVAHGDAGHGCEAAKHLAA